MYRSRHDKPTLAGRCCHVAHGFINFRGGTRTNEQTDRQKDIESGSLITLVWRGECRMRQVRVVNVYINATCAHSTPQEIEPSRQNRSCFADAEHSDYPLELIGCALQPSRARRLCLINQKTGVEGFSDESRECFEMKSNRPDSHCRIYET